MVKHIVMFKLKETLSAEEKLVVMNDFKAAIEALPAKIDVIRKVFVGLNINEAEQWDICLESEFDTLDELKKDIAEKVQQNIKDKIQVMTSTAVTKVNVVVADIEIEHEETEE